MHDTLLASRKRDRIEDVNVLNQFFERVSVIALDFANNIRALHISWLQAGVDILLVAVLFYYLFVLIRETRAFLVLKGFIMLGVILILSKIFSLVAVNWLLEKFLSMLVIAIPILFQQELREGLERLGRTRRFMSEKAREVEALVHAVVGACIELKKEKRGALIVFEDATPLKEYIETGVEMDAKVTKDLLVSIFTEKSPLHDGAVIIQNGRIKSAASLLPHSFKNFGNIHGTRHKAALALSESTDSKIIAISEERSVISWIERGRIEANLTAEKLQHFLGFLKSKPKKPHA